MVVIAGRARLSEKGLALRLTYASTAWVSASMPVSAVSRGGIDRVSSASITVASGRNAGPVQSIFSSVALSVMTVNWVASDPLPAVVGTAITGSAGPRFTCGAL